MKSDLSNERISMRTNIETKRYLEAAATLSGYNSLSSFVLNTAYKEAQRVFNESKDRVLSNRDRDLLLNLISKPPNPNKKLKNLLLQAEKHQSNKAEDEKGPD